MRNDYLDYLMHYGVVGMRWGHRKDKGEVTYTKLVKDRDLKSSTFKSNKQLNRLDSNKVSKPKISDTAKKTEKRLNNPAQALMDKIKKFKNSKSKSEQDAAKKEVEKKSKKAVEKGRDWWTQSIKVGKDKPTVSSAERVVSTGKTGVDSWVSLRKLRDEHKIDKKAVKEMSQLTNDELRDIVNRAKERRALEDDYMKYVASGVSRGRERTTETLESLGSALAVVGSFVTIASTVKSIGNIVNGKDDG